MRDLNKMRERYLRDEWPVRLGNLASDMLRLSNWVQMRHSDQAVVELMRETAWLIEWTAGDTPSAVLADLADMQRELCLWRRVWPLESGRRILALRARLMSQRALELSGLLISSER